MVHITGDSTAHKQNDNDDSDKIDLCLTIFKEKVESKLACLLTKVSEQEQINNANKQEICQLSKQI